MSLRAEEHGHVVQSKRIPLGREWSLGPTMSLGMAIKKIRMLGNQQGHTDDKTEISARDRMQ